MRPNAGLAGVLVAAGVALDDGLGVAGVLLGGRRVAGAVALGVIAGVAVGVEGVHAAAIVSATAKKIQVLVR